MIRKQVDVADLWKDKKNAQYYTTEVILHIRNKLVQEIIEVDKVIYEQLRTDVLQRWLSLERKWQKIWNFGSDGHKHTHTHTYELSVRVYMCSYISQLSYSERYIKSHLPFSQVK